MRSTHRFKAAQHVSCGGTFREMGVNAVEYNTEDGGQNGSYEQLIELPWGIAQEILEKKQDGEQRDRQQESERHSICPFEQGGVQNAKECEVNCILLCEIKCEFEQKLSSESNKNSTPVALYKA